MTKFNTDGWVYILTFGYSLDIYAFGCLRIGIDRNTGKQRLGYVYKERGD